MQKKLFLTSSGLPQNLRGEFLKFLNADPEKLKVAFIPTATDMEENTWFVDLARKELREIGFSVEDVDLKEHDIDSLQNALGDKDVIFVNGGNTFYLLYWIRKSGFDRIAKEMLEKGKLYIGSSAGSIVAGPDISLAGWEPGGDINGVHLENLKGMGFVDFAISPHFQMDSQEKLEKRQKKFPYKVIPLRDGQAISVKGDVFTIIDH